jgi:HAE1 family hydrophobic/amphiphilic exporter-1
LSLTRLFINRPTLVFVLVALMIFAGVLSTVTIVKELFPNVSQPTITVSVSYNGASVTEMRDNVVQPIEQNLAGTPDLQSISATVQQGQASISALFTIDSDKATDLALTQKAVQAAQKQLPTNITPPTVNVRDPSESTVVSLGLYSSKLSISQLSLYAQGVIAPQIEQLPGISFANPGGVVTPAYEVEVDPARLAAADLTLNDVIATISDNNARVPGGYAYEANRQTTIDVRADIQNLEMLRDLPIITTGGVTGLSTLPGAVNPWSATNSVVRIADVANVVQGNEPRQQFAQINGRPGLFFQVQKSSNASELDAANNVIGDLDSLKREFPQIEFTLVNTQAKFTRQQIATVTRTLLYAMLLTALAMVFFLRSWRSAIVVCISIPTSLAIAITVMKIMNLTIDTVSLLGMSLVIGILVDDSTVVLENIERHFRLLKEPPKEAAVNGRTEIGAAAIVITLVDVVVFLPIAFIGGQVGRNIAEFAIVVVISTLTSLFISFTVTPALAGLWALRSQWRAPKVVEWFGRKFDDLRLWYSNRVLPWSLDHRVGVAVFCIATFVVALSLIPLGAVGEEFIPASDRGQIFVQLNYPIGTPVSKVKVGAFALERAIDKLPDVASEAATAGAYSASFGGYVTQSNVAQINVFLKDDRKRSTEYWAQQLSQIAHSVVPDARSVAVPSTGTGGGNGQPIDFIVSDLTGGDPTSAAEKVLNLLRTVPGATSVNSTGTQLGPEVSIEFDRARAQALDVDIGSAAQAAGAAFGGAVATQFETTAGLEQVQVIYPTADQSDLEVLRQIPIRAQNGAIVHLGDFTTIVSTPTAPLITRTDRNTVIHVNANFAASSSLSGVESGLLRRLPSLHLPPNISVTPAPLGQQDEMHQTLSGMGSSMILSVILAYLLMVVLYNSYLTPFIIIMSVPVAAVGALGALSVTHQTLNLFSLIGMILLIGISTKNGILLVDYANTLRTRGYDKLAAIKESAFTRFRPIIMTSCSVVAGNIPLAVAFEAGSGSRQSLGTVVIGGVLSSLALTLLLIPSIYMWLSPPDQPVKRDGEVQPPFIDGMPREEVPAEVHG